MWHVRCFSHHQLRGVEGVEGVEGSDSVGAPFAGTLEMEAGDSGTAEVPADGADLGAEEGPGGGEASHRHGEGRGPCAGTVGLERGKQGHRQNEGTWNMCAPGYSEPFCWKCPGRVVISRPGLRLLGIGDAS